MRTNNAFRHWRARAVVGRGRRASANEAVTRAGSAAGRQRGGEPALAAARRAQLHGLLLGLPLAEVHALLAPGEDLEIPEEQLRRQFLLLPGDKPTDYIKTSMPAADAEDWFGKPPPDLSLDGAFARQRLHLPVPEDLLRRSGQPPTGVNNLRLPGTAMPHVLVELEGVQEGRLRRTSKHKGEDGKPHTPSKEFEKFEPGVVGSLNAEQYDEFVRDTVNFLEYVGEPTQLERQGLGIWVVLFLLMFTGSRGC